MIEERITSELSTRQLAAELSVSARALQFAFADVLGASPYQYILKRKLQAVRRELRNTPRHATNVYNVAFKYGFTDLGRFSVRYRRMFVESPSVTLREGTMRLRAGQ